MSQPPGFAEPIDALMAVATCLADLTIPNQAGDAILEPVVFVGDVGVGGVIDCCPSGVLRIESTGELPAQGMPINLGKHGCTDLTMGIRVTFLVCFKTISKAGTVITDPAELDYTRVIQASRWQAIQELKCCASTVTKNAIKFTNSQPINTDGKCSGWQIDLQAALSLCQPCESAS